MYNEETEPCSAEAKCDFRILVKSFWTQQQSFISKKVGHQKWCPFLILFVLVDAILQKVVYFKNKSGTGVVFWLYACIL